MKRTLTGMLCAAVICLGQSGESETITGLLMDASCGAIRGSAPATTGGATSGASSASAQGTTGAAPSAAATPPPAAATSKNEGGGPAPAKIASDRSSGATSGASS